MANQLFSVASVLFFLSTAVLGSKDEVAPAKLRHRNLQDLSPFCSALLEPLFEDQPVSCTCAPILFPDFSFSATCKTTDPICLDDLICVSPRIKAGVAMTGAVTFDVCLSEISVGGGAALINDLCISQLSNLLSPGATAADSDNCRAVGENGDGEKLECTSCTICPTGGYMFNCTNIDEQLVSSTCSGYYPNSFGDVSSPQNVGVPKLDGL